MKMHELKPLLVEYMPDKLESGVLYISYKFMLTIHLCACGCGGKTSLLIKGANDWTMTESNGLYTLRPSIGNFKGEDPHHAHYYITNNKIEWL